MSVTFKPESIVGLIHSALDNMMDEVEGRYKKAAEKDGFSANEQLCVGIAAAMADYVMTILHEELGLQRETRSPGPYVRRALIVTHGRDVWQEPTD